MHLLVLLLFINYFFIIIIIVMVVPLIVYSIYWGPGGVAALPSPARSPRTNKPATCKHGKHSME